MSAFKNHGTLELSRRLHVEWGWAAGAEQGPAIAWDADLEPPAAAL